MDQFFVLGRHVHFVFFILENQNGMIANGIRNDEVVTTFLGFSGTR